MKKLQEIFEYLNQEKEEVRLIEVTRQVNPNPSNFSSMFMDINTIFRQLEDKYLQTQRAYDDEFAENNRLLDMLSHKKSQKNYSVKNASINSSVSIYKSVKSSAQKNRSVQVKMLEQKLLAIKQTWQDKSELLQDREKYLREIEECTKVLRRDNCALENAADSKEAEHRLYEQVELNRRIKEKIKILSCFEEVVDLEVANQLEDSDLLTTFRKILAEHELLGRILSTQTEIQLYEKLLGLN